MIVDFRKSTVPPPPPSVMDSPITSVESFRFLGTTITQDLKWEPTISSLIKKAQQRMYFLRQLRKAKLPAQMLVQFYTAIIESILTSSITVWFAGATVRDKQRLQRIVRSAEEVIGRSLPSLQDLPVESDRDDLSVAGVQPFIEEKELEVLEKSMQAAETSSWTFGEIVLNRRWLKDVEKFLTFRKNTSRSFGLQSPQQPSGTCEQQRPSVPKETVQQKIETVSEDSFECTRVAVRQQEIVNSAPPVENVKARWPALYTERQVLAEFNQITSSKLGNDFVEALDCLTTQFIKLLRPKGGLLALSFPRLSGTSIPVRGDGERRKVHIKRDGGTAGKPW
uniref:Alkylated DNA repair protein AlkB homologue 8 N-terminal domain-containing protein n=1 Tax=Knipowitschia caucasica TaxID=637954 RepID=A0AAV2JFE0_KNICA